ncbi:hypothetical protein [Kitasatospora sp. NPDC005856]|uniref:hypothetical protein n=1 Tax=Kitasatospora sp. NPDC005856 TaxID=3154566 RepID=UPI0033D12C94
MRARDLCEHLDLAIMPKNIESTRRKLKRLVGLGGLVGPEPGLFAQHCTARATPRPGLPDPSRRLNRAGALPTGITG